MIFDTHTSHEAEKYAEGRLKGVTRKVHILVVAMALLMIVPMIYMYLKHLS